MSSRRRSISRNTRPRSVKIPISFLHARERSTRRSVDFFAVDTRRRYSYHDRRRCIAALRAIFEWTMHFSGTRRNRSLLSLSLSLSLSRSRAWERAKKKVERPDLVDNVRISLSPYPMNRQCAKGEEKKLRTRGGSAFP